MLPLQVDIDLVLRCIISQLLVLACLYVLVIPVAEELAILRQAHKVRIILWCLPLGLLIHEEKSYTQLLIVKTASILSEQVRALPYHVFKQLGILFLKRFWGHYEIEGDSKYGFSMADISTSRHAIHLELFVSLVEVIRESTREYDVVKAFDALFLRPSPQNIESGFIWERLFLSLNFFFDLFSFYKWFWLLRRIYHLDYFRLLPCSQRSWSNWRWYDGLSDGIFDSFSSRLLILILPDLLIYLSPFRLYLGENLLRHR